MKKRLISMFLIVILCLGTLLTPVMALQEDDPLFNPGDGNVDHTEEPEDDIHIDDGVTAEDLETSDAGIQMIKDLEGFTEQPFKDVSQMSIGYGCSTVYAEKYGFDPDFITREEADQLILYVIGEHEQKLDQFLEQYDISLNQSQYDSLISFSFNVGNSWMKADYRLAALLIDGDYSVNEFASAMGIWCHVGKTIDRVLINRRIREIKLFLYGAYALEDTYNKFSYLIFDGNGGSPQVDIAFFLDGEPYGKLYTAEQEGQYFQGWYSKDGKKITEGTIVEDSMTVYAQWGSEPPEEETEHVDLTQVFRDVYAEDWYLSYATDLYESGVVNGFVDGTFRASRTVSIGEALKMIMLAAGYEEPEPVASHWARSYLNLVLEEGIVERGEITDLDVPITRAMMAKIAANALRITQVSEETPFSDTDNAYIMALYDHGIVDGYVDGTFKPNNSLRRDELTAIVWRIQNAF